MARTIEAHVASFGPKRVSSTRTLPHIPGGKIPEPLAAITRKAMAMRQDDRYQTVKDLQAAVQAFQTGQLIVPAGKPSAPGKTEAPVPTGKKSNLLLIVLAVIIAVLAGLCVKLLMDRSRIEAELHGKK